MIAVALKSDDDVATAIAHTPGSAIASPAASVRRFDAQAHGWYGRRR